MPKEKKEHLEERPCDAAHSSLDVQITEKTVMERSVVTVTANYKTRTYVRVAEAKLETRHCAEYFAKSLHARKRQGLDPLAGMDPVMSYTIGGDHACIAWNPAFVSRITQAVPAAGGGGGDEGLRESA